MLLWRCTNQTKKNLLSYSLLSVNNKRETIYREDKINLGINSCVLAEYILVRDFALKKNEVSNSTI